MKIELREYEKAKGKPLIFAILKEYITEGEKKNIKFRKYSKKRGENMWADFFDLRIVDVMNKGYTIQEISKKTKYGETISGTIRPRDRWAIESLQNNIYIGIASMIRQTRNITKPIWRFCLYEMPPTGGRYCLVPTKKESLIEFEMHPQYSKENIRELQMRMEIIGTRLKKIGKGFKKEGDSLLNELTEYQEIKERKKILAKTKR